MRAAPDRLVELLGLSAADRLTAGGREGSDFELWLVTMRTDQIQLPAATIVPRESTAQPWVASLQATAFRPFVVPDVCATQATEVSTLESHDCP